MVRSFSRTLLKPVAMLKAGLPAAILFIPLTISAQWLPHTPQNKVVRAESPKARVKWFYDQRQSGGEIPRDAYAKAVNTTNHLKANVGGKGSKLAAQPRWKLIGPSNIDGNMAHAGRVLSVAVHPTNSSIAYAGAANGGIWKTTNKGQRWVPLTDNALSLATGALTIDPTDPNTIYAGTGEQSEGVGSYYGAGIIRSTDAGATWKNLGLHEVGAFVEIVVHPKNPNRIYAAGGRSAGGVFRSDDKGATWKKLTGGLPPSGASDLSVSIDGDRDILFAAMPSAGIFRSTDGGNSWTNVQSFTDMRRMHVDAQQNNWLNVVALSANNSGNFEAVARSYDGGESWEDMVGDLEQDIFQVGSSAQGWYDAYIRIDPVDPNRVFMGGISAWRTEDGGGSWQDVGLAYQGGVHPDQQNIAIAPSDPNVVYFANDGGVWVSEDGGNVITSYDDDLAITQFYGITIDQTVGDLTYGGTQDNGSLYGNSTDSWTEFAGGDGSFVQVDQNNPSTIFYIRPGDDNNPIRSDNGNETYLSSGIRSSDTTNWLKPILYDSKNNRFYYATTHFYVSGNKGSSFTRKAKQLAFNGTTISYIEAFGDGKTLLLGTTGGKVHYTTDEGSTFQDRSAGLPGRWVTSVKFSPGSKTRIYASLSGFGGGHVFRSDDAGATWTNISANLPDVPVNELLIDPDNVKGLYAATDVGVFFSPNDGEEWVPYGTGLPNVAVFDMDIHLTRRVLRAGTHGRSIWEVPLSNDAGGITSPTAGSIWQIGEDEVITWRGMTGETTVEYSTDAGDTWTEVGTTTATSVSIPNLTTLPTNNAVVRVYSGTDTMTSGLFQIKQLKAGMVARVVTQQPLYLYDIAYDKDENVLWATHYGLDAGSTKLYKFHPDNGTLLGSVNLGAGKNNLTGIKYDPETKHLWVHQAKPDNTSSFYKVTKTGTIVGSYRSPAVYGTGILVRDDTLYLVDRNPDQFEEGNRIFRLDKNDPELSYANLDMSRHSPFGGRCLAYDENKHQLLHTWTNFQGDDATARLYDSYLTWLDPNTGEELSYSYVQEGSNQGVNVRGLEIDPRDGGKTVWVTTLGDNGNSATILKLTLVDGPNGNLDVATGNRASTTLGQNYPNPFNPTTVIPFELTMGGMVEFALFDPMGREVLRSGEKFYGAGKHDAVLDASSLSSGTYTYTISVNGDRMDSKRMTLIK